MPSLHHLDLFSGIGGFALAARWTGGIETVAFCDNNPFCQRILRNHWPHSLLYEDIRFLTANRLRTDGVSRVDLVTGGFPCQPFSIAGKRGGAADDRHLWPQMRRVLAEVRPRWVVAENVAHFVHMALDDCLSDLEAEGYEAWSLVVPSCAVNAPHRRDRVFVVAYNERGGSEAAGKQTYSPTVSSSVADAASVQPKQLHLRRDATRPSGDLARASTTGGTRTSARSERGIQAGYHAFKRAADNKTIPGDWAFEPAVGRMAHGIPHRMDRLRSLGNAVVPQVVFPILNAIVEWEIKSGSLAPDSDGKNSLPSGVVA